MYQTQSYGSFHLNVTTPDQRGRVDLVLVKGEVRGRSDVLCRLTSRCTTSTAFDAYDCDCAAQMRSTLKRLQSIGCGLVIYLDQEGRGHGLATKVRAMKLKNRGLDTFSAIEALGLPKDITDYSRIPQMLAGLGVLSVRLFSNNPEKRASLQAVGINVTSLVPCTPDAPPTGALRHLEAKRKRGHIMEG
nr:GTP cyclohydrolase II [Actinomadura sp. WMMA1423]